MWEVVAVKRRTGRGCGATTIVLAAAVVLAACGNGNIPDATATNASTSATAFKPSGATPTAAKPTTTAAPSPAPSIDLHAAHAAILKRAPQVPVLNYHQVRDWTVRDSTQDRPYIMPVATFASQMDYLAQHGYHSISPDQLLAHLTTGAALPSKPVLLTFDDADENQWTNAVPVLKAHHFTATFFIMTVVLNKTNYMSDAQLRALDHAGMTIGGHTWDHHRVDRYSGSDWQIQIVRPTERLQRILGHPVRYFAYPYGVWKPDAFAHLEASGYWAAFQLNQDPVDASAPLYTLQRQIADPYWSTAQFAAHLTNRS